MVDIDKWLNEHAHTLDELNAIDEYQVLEATNEATYERDFEAFIEERMDELEREYQEYLENLKEEYEDDIAGEENPPTFEEWMKNNAPYSNFEEWLEDKKEELRNEFEDQRTPDDYYPIWNTVWEFPTRYTPDELNEKGIPGLIFFEAEYLDRDAYWDDFVDSEWERYKEQIEEEYEEYVEEFESEHHGCIRPKSFENWCKANGYTLDYDKWYEENRFILERDFEDWLEDMPKDWTEQGVLVGLTCCGMDMSPALHYAYLKYSSLHIDLKAILEGIMRKGKEYYKYVLGERNFKDLVETLGRDIVEEYDAEGKRRYKEFDEILKKLTELRDRGELDNTTAGLLGLMAFAKTQEPYKSE